MVRCTRMIAVVILQCDLIMKINKDLITVEKAGDNIKNELIVVANGFVTKCEDVFTGDKNWLKSYQDSSRCSGC